VNNRIRAGHRIHRAGPVLLPICLLVLAVVTRAEAGDSIAAGRFSAATPGETFPDGWERLTFSRIARHTRYSLVEEEGDVVVKAVSDRSASGMARAIAISPLQYPFIEWRWKVKQVLQKGDVTQRDGDDYPARIYITFAYDPDRAGYLERLKHEAARIVQGRELPYRAISYIWESHSPVGTMVPNSYTDRVMMFVVESGEEKRQQWVTERRNVFEDYKTAFGEEPAMISGVAIMTDTDNTGEAAMAWYGDIVFRSAPGD